MNEKKSSVTKQTATGPLNSKKTISPETLKSIQQQDDEYRLLHDFAGVAIGYYTVDGIVISYNKLAADNMGGKPQDFTGKSVFELFPTDAANKYMNRIISSVASSTPQEYTDKVELPNQVKWFTSTFARILNSKKQVIGVQIISHDITEKFQTELALQQKATLLAQAESLAHIGSWRFDLKTSKATWSDELYKIFGIERLLPDEDMFDIFSKSVHPENQKFTHEMWEAFQKDGLSGSVEYRILRPDGSVRWVSTQGTDEVDPSGQRIAHIGVVQDITERKNHELERQIVEKLVDIVSTEVEFKDMLASISASLQDWSGCEAVGIRLKEGQDYPYYETRGFSKEHIEAENRLCAYDKEGNLLLEGNGNPVLECMCGNILYGRFDPSKPFFTPHGSFWSNNTTELLASTSEKDRQARTRNRCNGEGYESVALIPLRHGNQVFGLLQFNDSRVNRFTIEMINQTESLADKLAMALSERMAQTELQKSEEKYRTVANFIYDWEAWRLPDGTFRYVSPSCERITGHKAAEFLTDPQLLFQLIHPDDLKKLEDHYQDINQRAQIPTEHLHFRIITANDEIRWISHWCSAVYGQNGEFLGRRESNRDITDRKKVEEALRQSEERFRVTQEVSPDGFTILRPVRDANGRVVDFTWVYENATVASWNGTDPKAVVGKRLLELFPSHAGTQFMKAYQSVAETGKQVIFEEEYSGETITNSTWFRIVVITIGLDIAILAQNITKRKQMEEALRTSQQEFEQLIQSLHAGVVVHAADTSILIANQEASRLLGLTIDQMIGKMVIDPVWRFVHEDGTPMLVEEYPAARVFATQSPIDNMVLGITHPNTQDLIWVLVSAFPEFDSTGQIHRLVVTFIDITDRKLAEDALQQKEAQLNKIFDVLPVGLWLADKNGNLTRSNVKGREIWGAEPLVGQEKYGVFRAHFLPSGKELAPEDWALTHSINEGVTVLDEMLEIDAFDGKKKVILNYTAPFFDNTGNIDGAVIVNLDITKRQQAEAKINEQLIELKRWYNTTLGREDRVMELKREVNKLLAEAGKPPHYTSVE